MKFAKPPRTVRSLSVKLNAEQLPDLVMPALWAIGMESQWTGTPGDTAATVSGPLSYASQWPLNESGAAIVEAASASEAVSLAFAGAITVHCGAETLTYQMGPSAFSAAGPFRYLDGAIQLEDMAGSANGSDFDYNDHFWLVTTTPIPEGGGGSGGGGGTSPPPTVPPPTSPPYTSPPIIPPPTSPPTSPPPTSPPTSPPYTSPPTVPPPAIDFDLDVDLDPDVSLAGPFDRAVNYLPGYKGPTAMVSTGNSFNVPTYTSQRMRLVIDGIGSTTARISRVVFEIVQVSADPGYASNRSDPSVEGVNNTDDYSFQRNGNGRTISITRTPTSMETILHGGEYGGGMTENKTWVNFYCKDYGGASRLRATVLVFNDNNMEVEHSVHALSVPIDNDIIGPNNVGDGIADKWEIAMGARWSAQYGLPALTPQEAMAKFSNFDDNELADPDKDGTTQQGPLSPQAETGDAHTVKEEYRGYVLDGGGLDGAGINGHSGGHIRLDPARKEILVEVDRAAVLNNVPGAGNDTNAKLKTILNGASGVFSNATRGAGIYMYWLMDDKELNIALADANTKVKEMTALSGARNSTLATDFIHALMIDTGCLEAFEGNGIAYGRIDTEDLTRRGVVLATTDTTVSYKVADYPKREELFSSVFAHELTHMIIPDFTVSAGFDDEEHMFAPQADKTELMFKPRSKDNREFATVKIGPLAQKVFKIRSTEGISN